MVRYKKYSATHLKQIMATFRSTNLRHVSVSNDDITFNENATKTMQREYQSPGVPVISHLIPKNASSTRSCIRAGSVSLAPDRNDARIIAAMSLPVKAPTSLLWDKVLAWAAAEGGNTSLSALWWAEIDASKRGRSNSKGDA